MGEIAPRVNQFSWSEADCAEALSLEPGTNKTISIPTGWSAAKIQSFHNAICNKTKRKFGPGMTTSYKIKDSAKRRTLAIYMERFAASGA